ncbi:hypothetical protein [Acidovorax sp. NCPPB 4044]|uniref:hypothetical protein n=1 Tax=Acidovorax sp. NCPPB 4044 TaxID=2940490 RepID=UPI002304C68E|nr:hypothetical protein [Acidovorax sp. NCPPB 4044]MDA8522017.1 hypothetical protein [Acidovorax sp. NCPPB 4044]
MIETTAQLAARDQAIGPTILLASGRYFNFERPEETPISVEDVAHALSKLCRFTGHCRGFYSVAQHAVLVSYLVPPEHAFHALHHDDVEAVMGDMSSPLKRLLPEYKALEHRVEAAILAQFGLPAAMPAEVKHADLVALRTEQRDLMHIAGGRWPSLDGIEPSNMHTLEPMEPEMARRAYLARHFQLLPANRVDPTPESDAPANDAKHYIPDPGADGWVSERVWKGTPYDLMRLRRGLVYRTAEDAEARARHMAAAHAGSAAIGCTCPSGDGSLRWPCPTHPPAGAPT